MWLNYFIGELTIWIWYITFTIDYLTALNCWITVKSTLVYIRVIKHHSIIKRRSQSSPLTPKLLPTSSGNFFLGALSQAKIKVCETCVSRNFVAILSRFWRFWRFAVICSNLHSSLYIYSNLHSSLYIYSKLLQIAKIAKIATKLLQNCDLRRFYRL